MEKSVRLKKVAEFIVDGWQGDGQNRQQCNPGDDCTEENSEHNQSLPCRMALSVVFNLGEPTVAYAWNEPGHCQQDSQQRPEQNE
jgi:hypothetical protein